MATAEKEKTKVVHIAIPHHGFTQIRLATAIGVSGKRMTMMLQARAVAWNTVERIAAALGVPPEALATKEVKYPDQPGEMLLGVWLDA